MAIGKRKTMDVSEYLASLAFSIYGGLEQAETPTQLEKMVFVNDFERVRNQLIREYDTWYSGSGDDLYNLYNENAIIEYQSEPYQWKNKRSYFWARASQEDDIKRTHSGFPKDIIDTMVSICGEPVAKVGGGRPVSWQEGEDDPTIVEKPKKIGGKDAKSELDDILKENDFWSLYRQKQMPLTLVEGWGCYKIAWDGESSYPYIYYYGAESCRIYKRGSRVYGVTFLDWYKDPKGQRYLIAETRVMSHGKGTVRIDAFKETGAEQLMAISDFDDKPWMDGLQNWDSMPCLFAEPCSFYADTLHNLPGRSVFEGKCDIFDDLDQAYSQAANTVRRSTPIEVFDLDFCDRDKHGVPKLPKTYERRYIGIRGARGTSGEQLNSQPVQVTQPQLNLQVYDDHIMDLERAAINGHLSPATMGLDVAKRDNADAQREKEKVTIFTRNHLTKEEARILSSLFNQLLIAREYLVTGKVTETDYEVSVLYDEFATASYDEKMASLAPALANGAISPEMFVDKVYGNSIPSDKAKKEVKWIEERLSPQNQGGIEDLEKADSDNPLAVPFEK